MFEHSLMLTILPPIFASLVATLMGLWKPRFALPVALGAIGFSMFGSIITLASVTQDGFVQYFLGNWSEPRGIGIEFRVDHISALMLVLITSVAFLSLIYASGKLKEEVPGKEPLFYTLYLLLTGGLLGICMTADAFNLYVMLEITSLTSYALVAMGSGRRAAFSAYHYVIMGTIGASFYLLGVGYLYIRTGSLNMMDINRIILEQGLQQSPTIIVAFIMILIGMLVKMAFFPLSGWLTNTYTHAPSCTGNLAAPLMTKVSVYVMVRMMLTVFGVDFVFDELVWSPIMVWLAVIAIGAGSIMALAQTDLKRMLCCLIIAEVGYMVGGAWLANHHGMTGAIFHIFSDGAMTLCLFLAAGIFFHKNGTGDIGALKGMYQRMPLTMGAFTLGAFSMIGVPPTCGFFSKFYLIRGGLESGHYEYVVALLLSSLVNAILFFRIFETAYFGDLSHDDHGHDHHHEEVEVDEAPPTMLAPLIVAAVSLVILGLYNSAIASFIGKTLTPLAIGGAG